MVLEKTFDDNLFEFIESYTIRIENESKMAFSSGSNLSQSLKNIQSYSGTMREVVSCRNKSVQDIINSEISKGSKEKALKLFSPDKLIIELLNQPTEVLSKEVKKK